MDTVFRLLWVWLSYPWSWFSQIFQALFPNVENAFSTFFISMACYFAIFKFIVIPIFGSGKLTDLSNSVGSSFNNWVNRRD